MRISRFLAPLVGAFLLLPATADAQSRGDLLRQATAELDDFDAPRAIRLARAALNPSLGPLDTTWVRGVHVLAQVLIEEQQAEVAKTWAQWAMRTQPTMEIDSVNFLSNVVTLLRDARGATVQTVGDEKTRTTYQWPAANVTTDGASFRIASGASPVTVFVRGIGIVGAAGLNLPAGTYELEVSASGFLPMTVAREALPGVTAEFAFTLTPAAAAAATLAADVSARLSRATVPLQV